MSRSKDKMQIVLEFDFLDVKKCIIVNVYRSIQQLL